MKRIISFIFIMLLFCSNVFAELRTRVDRYGKQSTKIIWNSKYSSEPDNTNWSKSDGESLTKRGWVSCLEYYYIIDLSLSAASVRLYESKRGTYTLWVSDETDGLWETKWKREYYDYNVAKYFFTDWANYYEGFIR